MKIQDYATPTIVVVLVCGALGLAVVDKAQRSPFTDLAKIGLGGYLGFITAQSKNKLEP